MIRWTDEAIADFAGQIAWIHERNSSAAERIAEEILTAIALLEDYPLAGRVGRHEGTRELVTTAQSYLVVYPGRRHWRLNLAGAARRAALACWPRLTARGLNGLMTDATETTTLWRPVGPEELALIQALGMCSFPPRLPEQPIFYPVLTEGYAAEIARGWNVRASGSGYVTRFEVRADFLARYPVQEAGGRTRREYWIPAEDLPAFNAAIVGQIEVVAEFR